MNQVGHPTRANRPPESSSCRGMGQGGIGCLTRQTPRCTAFTNSSRRPGWPEATRRNSVGNVSRCSGTGAIGIKEDGILLRAVRLQTRHDHHREQWREARALLSDRSSIVADNVVLSEQSLEVAGMRSVTNRRIAQAAAHDILCQAGRDLVKLCRGRPDLT
jgi:hypothetical protein